MIEVAFIFQRIFFGWYFRLQKKLPRKLNYYYLSLTREHNRQELQEILGLSDREHFRKTYLQPAFDNKFIELSIPEKPKSGRQKYRMTPLAEVWLKKDI